MSLKSSLQKIKSVTEEFLRLILEDKEMKGHNFGHLKVRDRMLYIDEESETYKNMLPKIYQEPRVNDFGCIVLPSDIRKELKNTDLVEYWKISNEQYIITVTKSPPVSRKEKLDEFLAKRRKTPG